MKKHWLIVALVVAGFYYWSTRHPVTYGYGIVAPHSPDQIVLKNAPAFFHKEYKITPLAHFEAEARVLSLKRYSFDRESDLSPLDLALGWGPMSDERVLEKLKISQSSRFYYWWAKDLPLPEQRITQFSANMHMIPSCPEIAKLLKGLRKGDLLKFRGSLVRVDANDGWRWVSSLKRTDSGNGACEVVWIEDAALL